MRLRLFFARLHVQANPSLRQNVLRLVEYAAADDDADYHGYRRKQTVFFCEFLHNEAPIFIINDTIVS